MEANLRGVFVVKIWKFGGGNILDVDSLLIIFAALFSIFHFGQSSGPQPTVAGGHRRLERLKKSCSHPVEWKVQPGLLIFDFVSAQFQVHHEPAPSRKPRQKSKLPAPNGYSISLTALTPINHFSGKGADIVYRLTQRRALATGWHQCVAG
jgi:hypothetical protein